MVKDGYNLSVFNRSKDKSEELITMGAKFMDPIKMTDKCNIIFTMLGFPKDIENIVLGEEGILKKMKPGSILVDHTTSSPDLAEYIYKEAKRFGIISYDAPVSGGDIGARNGKLVVMAGGDAMHFHMVENIMKTYSASVKLMGDAGKGQHTKMANQIIIASTMIGLIEGLVYGQKAGLDLNSLIKLLSNGAAGSFSMNSYGERILNRNFEPGFYIEHFVKDLQIALMECEKMNLKLKGLELAHLLYKNLILEGYGKKGTQALILALEKINGINCNL